MVELEYEWWEYFLIPWIAAFVGYGTNVLALWLTFYPLDYFGLKLFRIKDQPWGFFGWQGIIPTKAEKMASISFDLMTKRLFNIQEIFKRLDPAEFSVVMEDPILLMMDEVITSVALKHMPQMWSKLPAEVKDDIIVTAGSECGSFMSAFMQDMQNHVDDVVDIKEMCVQKCVENKHLIVKIFQECGEKEFVFIRQSGFYFGFLFGCVQMGVWFFYSAGWVLPVAGFLVGWVTNWIALTIIFRPLEPTNLGCYTLHGLFLQRQQEVSETFARVICVEILHIKAIWESIFKGRLSKNFFAMLRAHTLVFTDKLLAEIEPLVIAGMGAQNFLQMKEDIAQKVLDKIPDAIDASYVYTQDTLDMENTIKTEMAKLSSVEFEGVLHPAFQEDEIQLIALGGFLGALVGVIQLFTIFA